MEHSKLPQDLNNALAYSWVLGWYAGRNGELNDSGKRAATEKLKTDYPNIVTACNEYATLKAKEALFDEAIELLDKANRRVIADNQSVPDRHYPFEVTVPAGELLSKAKELK